MVHGQLPGEITRALNAILPDNYLAGPTLNLGSVAEVDIGTFHSTPETEWPPAKEDGGVVAVVAPVWTPPRPGLSVEADWSKVDDYEVKVYDVARERELVAAIEIVSPSNKDRPEHRRQFAAKCAALVANQVSVVVIDFVTARLANLYVEMLETVGQRDPALPDPPHPIYAIACRSRRAKRTRLLEAWYHPLAVGQPLPTLPLWLNDRLAVPLELETIYEETLRVFRVK